MKTIEYLDRPPAGWHALDVMRAHHNRKWDNWVCLMVDVHPDELKHCLYTRRAQEAWVRVPGKYRNKEAAWEALQDMLATRH